MTYKTRSRVLTRRNGQPALGTRKERHDRSNAAKAICRRSSVLSAACTPMERERNQTMARELTRRFLLAGAASGAGIAALPGCVPPSAAAPQIGPQPANAARIWFYRDYEPSVSLN